MLAKMQELDNNPELYKKVFDDCMDCIRPEDLDGSNVVNFIMSRIYKDMDLEYINREGCESIFNRFSREMF